MSQSSTAGIDMLLEIIDAEDTEPPPAAAEPPPAAAEPPPAAAEPPPATAEPPPATAEPPPAAAEPPPAASRARKLPAFARAAGGGPTPAARKLPRFDEAARSGALPPLALPVPIVYTRSEGEADELCEALVAAADAGTLSLVGFDIEWTVTYESGKTQRPAALVQLATGTSVYLFHVAAMGRFPERLATVIEDGRVLKAGSKVLNDMHKLRRDFGLQAAGLLEHQRLAAAVLTYGERPWSLSELVEACLRRHLPKEERVRTSAWESTCLDDEQTRYAALDAWASRAVALELLSRQRETPPAATAASAAATVAACSTNMACTTMASTTAMACSTMASTTMASTTAMACSTMACTAPAATAQFGAAEDAWHPAGVPMRLVDSIEVDPMWSRRTGGRQWLHRRGE